MDRRIPFVDAVFRVSEGTLPLQQAVDVLCRAEQLAGVKIIGDPVPLFVEGVMVPKDGVPPPSIGTIVRLSQDQSQLEELFRPAPELVPSIYEDRVYRLLNETHLVLTGGDLANRYDFIADGPVLFPSGTWRWWGDCVAGWANRHWFARPSRLGETVSRPWEYIHFYMHCYLEDLVVGYDHWAVTAVEVLREKNRQLLEREGLQDLSGGREL